MYKSYYRLKEEPFGTHPNTGTFFVSRTHKEAWYYLLFGIDTEEPFLVLTGEYGMGKTLLCLRLVKFLREKGVSRVEYCPTSNEGYGGVLRRIATNLGISPLAQDEEILQDMIYDRFRGDAEKQRFYLIVDDVHEFDANFMTKLKYLSTFNCDEFFPLVMIFVGHPSFLEELKKPALSSLNQRIKRRYNLARLDLTDTKNYIYFRLLKAGATGIPAFPEESLQRIFNYSAGIPRLIHNICDTCLLIGASRQLNVIPPEVVEEAKNLVGGSLPTQGAMSNPPLDARTDASSDEARILPGPPAQEPYIPASDDPLPITDEYQQEAPRVPKSAYFSGVYLKWVKRLALAVLIFLAAVQVTRYLTPLFGSYLFPPVKQQENLAGTPPPATVREPVPALRDEASTAPSPGQADVPEAVIVPPPASSAPPGATGDTNPSGTIPAAGHPYSLRLASYQKPEMAQAELAALKKMGLVGYLVRIDLGGMGIFWRIYAGFFPSSEEANRVKNNHRLAQAVVEKTSFACLVAEYASEIDSLSLFEKLRQQGHHPYLVQKEKNRFFLYMGAYEKQVDAENFAAVMKNHNITCRVVAR